MYWCHYRGHDWSAVDLLIRSRVNLVWSKAFERSMYFFLKTYNMTNTLHSTSNTSHIQQWDSFWKVATSSVPVVICAIFRIFVMLACGTAPGLSMARKLSANSGDSPRVDPQNRHLQTNHPLVDSIILSQVKNFPLITIIHLLTRFYVRKFL